MEGYKPSRWRCDRAEQDLVSEVFIGADMIGIVSLYQSKVESIASSGISIKSFIT